jgi:hypothetical protein
VLVFGSFLCFYPYLRTVKIGSLRVEDEGHRLKKSKFLHRYYFLFKNGTYQSKFPQNAYIFGSLKIKPPYFFKNGLTSPLFSAKLYEVRRTNVASPQKTPASPVKSKRRISL